MRTIVILLAIATLGAAQFRTLKQSFRSKYTATMMPPWAFLGHGGGTLTVAKKTFSSRATVFGTIAGLYPRKQYGIWGYNSTNCGHLGSPIMRFNNKGTDDNRFTTDDKGVLYLDFNTTGIGLSGSTDVLNHPIVIHEIELKNRFDYTCGILSMFHDEVSCCRDPALKIKARLVPWFTCCRT